MTRVALWSLMRQNPSLGTTNRLVLMEPNPGPLEAWLELSGLVASVVSR